MNRRVYFHVAYGVRNQSCALSSIAKGLIDLFRFFLTIYCNSMQKMVGIQEMLGVPKQHLLSRKFIQDIHPLVSYLNIGILLNCMA